MCDPRLANGQHYVCQFLGRGEFLAEEDERDRAVEDPLCELALEDMIRVIVRPYGY